MVGLDLLRVLAVVLVLGRHLMTPPESLPSALRAFFLSWYRGGWVGVDLFFVLSGFLISGLLFTEWRTRGHISIGRFYMRRGWKIYPPFFALVAITLLVHLAFRVPVRMERLLSDMLFLQSYWRGMWTHTWSLSVEEHFYLLLPLVLLFLSRINRGSRPPFWQIPVLAACLGVAEIVARLVNWYLRADYSHDTHIYPSHLRLDSLFFGVAISHAFHFHRAWFTEVLTPMRRWFVGLGLLLLAPAFVYRLDAPYIFTFGLTQFYLGSGLLLVGTILCETPRNRLVMLVASLGAYSYSIYLWHLPVRIWGIAVVEWAVGARLGFGASAAAFLIGSIVVGVLMARLVELPALKIRDRWFPSRSHGQP